MIYQITIRQFRPGLLILILFIFILLFDYYSIIIESKVCNKGNIYSVCKKKDLICSAQGNYGPCDDSGYMFGLINICESNQQCCCMRF